jgi:hypothetical protein
MSTLMRRCSGQVKGTYVLRLEEFCAGEEEFDRLIASELFALSNEIEDAREHAHASAGMELLIVENLRLPHHHILLQSGERTHLS